MVVAGQIPTIKFQPISQFYDDYDEKNDVGKGRFGVVKLCYQKATRKVCAAKFFTPSSKQEKENAVKEFDILKSLHHPNIIQCYNAYETGGEFILVLEYCGGGELFEKIVADDFCLTEKECQNYVRQITLALEYLHGQNIIHLDLKPENIMCVENSAQKIKLIDFGLAQRYTPGQKIKVLFGTPEFMAPEVVNYEDIDTNTDMWSLGVVTYVLLSGLSPFMGETTAETLNNITKANYDFDDEEFDDVSKDAKDFIRKLLVKNKNKRMTSSEALKHPWLKPTKIVKLKRINTKRHQKYLAHHRWQQAIGAIKTINILGGSDKNGKNEESGAASGLFRRHSMLKSCRSDPFLANSAKASLISNGMASPFYEQDEYEQSYITHLKPTHSRIFSRSSNSNVSKDQLYPPKFASNTSTSSFKSSQLSNDSSSLSTTKPPKYPDISKTRQRGDRSTPRGSPKVSPTPSTISKRSKGDSSSSTNKPSSARLNVPAAQYSTGDVRLSSTQKTEGYRRSLAAMPNTSSSNNKNSILTKQTNEVAPKAASLSNQGTISDGLYKQQVTPIVNPSEIDNLSTRKTSHLNVKYTTKYEAATNTPTISSKNLSRKKSIYNFKPISQLRKLFGHQ